MSKVIYIAGPMSGLKDLNVTSFKIAERELTRQGFEVRNPACLPPGWARYDDYMEICLVMLRQSDGVVFLPGSMESKGACIEASHAEQWGIPGETDLIRGVIPRLNAELLLAKGLAK